MNDNEFEVDELRNEKANKVVQNNVNYEQLILKPKKKKRRRCR